MENLDKNPDKVKNPVGQLTQALNVDMSGEIRTDGHPNFKPKIKLGVRRHRSNYNK